MKEFTVTIKIGEPKGISLDDLPASLREVAERVEGFLKGSHAGPTGDTAIWWKFEGY